MFEGLRDKAGFLDETICRLGEAIAEKASIEAAAVEEDFFRSAPDSFYALGRICCDANTDGARLNAHSILLQGNQVCARNPRVSQGQIRADRQNLSDPQKSRFPLPGR